MSKTLLFCGCGWLGQHAAATFKNKYRVIGTTRTSEKLVLLKNQGVDPLLFEMGQSVAPLFDSAPDYVVLNVPPGRRNSNLTHYIQEMKNIIDGAERAKTAHLIFVSTTSVYGSDVAGVINETSTPNPTTVSGRAHVELENYLENATVPFSVIRPSGLVGTDRHPINTLQGKALTNPDQVANLVHVDDVVQAIDKLLIQGPRNRFYLLSSIVWPKRGEYYPHCAIKKGLPPPTFENYSAEMPTTGKQIDGRKSWEELGITLSYPSPYDMI